jgi:hypothetical protein
MVDCVQGQGADSVLKRSVHAVREHLKPNRDAPLKNKIDAESGFAWQRSHRTQDAILKQLLMVQPWV